MSIKVCQDFSWNPSSKRFYISSRKVKISGPLWNTGERRRMILRSVCKQFIYQQTITRLNTYWTSSKIVTQQSTCSIFRIRLFFVRKWPLCNRMGSKKCQIRKTVFMTPSNGKKFRKWLGNVGWMHRQIFVRRLWLNWRKWAINYKMETLASFSSFLIKSKIGKNSWNFSRDINGLMDQRRLVRYRG